MGVGQLLKTARPHPLETRGGERRSGRRARGRTGSRFVAPLTPNRRWQTCRRGTNGGRGEDEVRREAAAVRADDTARRPAGGSGCSVKRSTSGLVGQGRHRSGAAPWATSERAVTPAQVGQHGLGWLRRSPRGAEASLRGPGHRGREPDWRLATTRSVPPVVGRGRPRRCSGTDADVEVSAGAERCRRRCRTGPRSNRRRCCTRGGRGAVAVDVSDGQAATCRTLSVVGTGRVGVTGVEQHGGCGEVGEVARGGRRVRRR